MSRGGFAAIAGLCRGRGTRREERQERDRDGREDACRKRDRNLPPPLGIRNPRRKSTAGVESGAVILENGVDPDDGPVAAARRALAIAGDRIAGGVGTHETALATPERSTSAAAASSPGFTDSHVHFPTWAVAQRQVRLDGAARRSTRRSRACGRRPALPAGRWLRGQRLAERRLGRQRADEGGARRGHGRRARRPCSPRTTTRSGSTRPRSRARAATSQVAGRRRRAGRARRADGRAARGVGLALQGAPRQDRRRRVPRRDARRPAGRGSARRHRRPRQGRLAAAIPRLWQRLHEHGEPEPARLAVASRTSSSPELARARRAPRPRRRPRCASAT